MKPFLEPDIDLSLFEPYKIDCEHCCGLCCVALYFSKTEGFPENKTAGKPCANLQNDYTCRIHSSLSKKGLKGCTAYDCFGAGQRIAGQLQERPDWKTIPPEDAKLIFDAYLTVMQLHQVLWYLTSALTLKLEKSEKEQLRTLIGEGQELAGSPLPALQKLNPAAFREKANRLLKNISNKTAALLLPRGSADIEHKSDSSGLSIGKNLRQKNLTGKDFSMSLLIAADLERAELSGANFLGADMRDTNIKNTDLSRSLFLTQIQINAAKGNAGTVLPPYLSVPESWK